jgi:predicted PurR-regulated permease PerM
MGITFSMLMAGVGLLGMAGQVASSTISGATQTNNLQQQLQDLNKSTAEWKEKYAQLLGGLNEISAEQIEYVQNMIDNYQTTATQIKASQDAANISYRQIQIVGLIFVTIIFILLLMKKFNLLRPFINIVDYPAKAAWNYIVHGTSTPFKLEYKSE